MFVANLSPMAIGLVLLLGCMAASAGITILVVVLLDRHNRLELEREFTALANELAAEIEHQQLVREMQALAVQTFEPDDDELLIIDDSAWDDPRDHAYEEDFAEWEVRSVEEADDRARMIELQRDLRICGDMVDAVADYLDQLHYHPDVVGAEHIPTLVAQLDELIEQEYHLIQITRVPEIIEF
jgi:hypothetical protein